MATGDRYPPIVSKTIQQAADAAGTVTHRVSVRSVESIDWPDPSLGVPEEGMSYAQVVTPGYRIVLEIDGETHIYHTDETSRIVRVA